MSSERQISLLLGTGGGFFAATHDANAENTQEFLSILPRYGVQELDTAAVYPGGKSGRSETLLGAVRASERFIIDTKIMVTGAHEPGAGGGDLSRERVLESWRVSCERLGVSKVRTLYCHRPDPGTPLVETAGLFDELFREGRFERVGFP